MTIDSLGDERVAETGGRAALGRRERAAWLTRLDAAMIGSVAISVVGNVVSAVLAAGWRTAVALDLILAAYFAAMALRRDWRALLGRLFLLGCVAGVIELFTDASGEHVVHSLSYPPGEPVLWASPVYMPLAWTLVLMQLGYLGWRLRGLAPRLSLGAACALTGLCGGLLVPFYEEMAYHAGWWQYAAAPGLGHTPFYVMLFEAAVAASLPLVLHQVERRAVWRAPLAGVIVGLWMPWAALFSWLLIGRG